MKGDGGFVVFTARQICNSLENAGDFVGSGFELDLDTEFVLLEDVKNE